MKLYDCFLYCGIGAEDSLVELRCHELDSLVTAHVIIEGHQDFQGHDKPLRFPKLLPRLRGFESRIHYVPLSLPESNVYPRAPGGRERFSRDALGTNVPAGDANDIIMLSDCDEIPRAAVLARLRKSGWVNPVQLGMTPYYLWMNLQIVSDVSEAPGQRNLWNGTLLVRRPTLEQWTAYQLRDVPGRKLVEDGGWHFSSTGGVEAMQAKLSAWGHPDKNTPFLSSMEHLTMCFENGMDWDTDRKPQPFDMRFVRVNDTYPAYVREHPEQFKAFIGGEVFIKG